MPVYNGEAFIAEAVASVFSSTFPDFELLLVDDGSTDRSIAVARAACRDDARLRVITLAHGGVAQARRHALSAAQGEFIANLDADDAMFPERFVRQLSYLEQHPECVAVGSRAVVVNSASRPTGIGVSLFTHEEIDGSHMQGHGGGIWNPTAMIRRDVAQRVGGYLPSSHATGEDYDLWLRLAEAGKLANLRDVLVRYRVHGGNSSLSAEARQRRWAITHECLTRAYQRRGISTPLPSGPVAPKRLSAAERARNAALLAYYSGRRLQSVFRAASATAHVTSMPASLSVLRTVLSAEPPRWDVPSTPSVHS